MTNLTIPIDENILRDAENEALHRKTSVNRMVVEYLAEIAGRQNRQRDAVNAIRALIREQTTEIDPATYRRADLYELETGNSD